MPRIADLSRCKEIRCILPDDGTDKRVLLELRNRQGIIRSISATRRGLGSLAAAKAKPGTLPEPELVRELQVVCPEEQSEEVFAFIFWFAELDKPGRGIMWQQPVFACTPYELPADVPDEGAITDR